MAIRWAEAGRRAGSSVWAVARRRPGLALVAAAVLVLVGPLAVDLFFAIPWGVRKLAGRAGCVAIAAAALARVWTVRPGDDPFLPDDRAGTSWREVGVPVLVCAALAVPLLKNPDNLGAGDWDFNLQKYESVRRSVLEFGEFPWWDPWCRGGFPLAANPQCGVVGVATPLVLAMGTSVGLRVAAVVCLLLATEGARRLARAWLGDPLAAAVAGLVYGVNGGVLIQTVAGYHLPMSYAALPWLLYYATSLDRRRADGVGLGAWLAFGLLNGINYYTVYAVMVGSVVWLRGLAMRARDPATRGRFLNHSTLAAGTFLALAGWRLATTGLVYRDFPRPFKSAWAESFGSMLVHLLDRPTAARVLADPPPYFWETASYVGPVALTLAAASLFHGWRWWHTLAAVCGWLASGSVAWTHPSFWLSDLPLFSSMHVVTRWRVVALLGMGLAAGDALAALRRRGPWARRLAFVGMAAIGLDYVALGYQVLPLAFRIPPDASRFPGPAVRDVVQVADGGGFPSVLRGYGVIRMQEPLLGYDVTAPTERRWLGGPGYRGEWWTDAGPIRPVSWGPNRVSFRVAPGETMYVNQNPGSWWWVNGRPGFPGWRCAETQRVFSARADARGRLDLRAYPRGLGLGLALHVAGLATIVSALVLGRGYRV